MKWSSPQNREPAVRRLDGGVCAIERRRDHCGGERSAMVGRGVKADIHAGNATSGGPSSILTGLLIRLIHNTTFLYLYIIIF